MEKSLYIGEFPPPMGGVTVKNALIRDSIYKKCGVVFFDLYSCKKNPLNILKLFFMIYTVKGKIVIGVGSNPRLERLLQLISLIKGRSALNQCSVIMMGSTLQNYSKNHLKLQTYLKSVRSIYTESVLINKDFAEQGIYQTEFFPNCRKLPSKNYAGKSLKGKKLRVVFFSKVCKEKGAHSLFEIVGRLNKMGVPVDLDYYGVIDSVYKREFQAALSRYKNVCYKGVFDSSKDDVYEKLSEYDVLLFPTIWYGEGVAGILVESKIAGIPAIVTDHNYNGEVVIGGKEGIVVPLDNIVDGFVESIFSIQKDKVLFERLANGAYQSRERYDIENYREVLLDAIKG